VSGAATVQGVDPEVRGARAAWSALTEPADREAGLLVSLLGPREALAWVRQGVTDLAAAAARLHGLCAREDAVAVVRAHERWMRRLDYAGEDWVAKAGRCGVRVVVPGDQEWPAALDDLGLAAPHALWVRGQGNLGGLLHRAVAVVGARAATHYGEYVTRQLTTGLADAGWTVVSGGAYGIDGAAHRTCEALGAPTVAFMAGGVDRLYPAGHEELLRAMLDRGCVVAEVPVGSAPQRSRFLHRNRLIATARATVVVEAGFRSGALNTATHANELLRPVGAVPGSVESASSAGCHRLIRDGAAVLVTCADDVLALAEPVGTVAGDGPAGAVGDSGGGSPGGASGQVALDFAAPGQRRVYDVLGPRARSLEWVASAAGMTLEQARTALGSLSLDGRAARRDVGWVRT